MYAVSAVLEKSKEGDGQIKVVNCTVVYTAQFQTRTSTCDLCDNANDQRQSLRFLLRSPWILPPSAGDSGIKTNHKDIFSLAAITVVEKLNRRNKQSVYLISAERTTEL